MDMLLDLDIWAIWGTVVVGTETRCLVYGQDNVIYGGISMRKVVQVYFLIEGWIN